MSISFEQHQEIGKELWEMRKRLAKITATLEAAYPYEDLRGQAGNTVRAIDDLCRVLDNLVWAENRDREKLHTVYCQGLPAQEETCQK